MKVIVEYEGKFLYVRNSYGHRRITFPGGKIEAGEMVKQAAIREVREEVGLELLNVRRVGSFISTDEGKCDNIEIFYGQSKTDRFELDEFEIAEAGWFEKSELPNFGPIAGRIWDIFIEKNH